jgi:hypothetical protein
MNKLLFLLTIGIFSSGVNAGAICNDPLKPQVLCNEMKHLRSQVLALGAQRDLMQVNYPYYEAIGNELTTAIDGALLQLGNNSDSHAQSLAEIKKASLDFIEKAKAKNPDTFRIANQIQTQCATCHSSENPQSGYKWEEIFKLDWSVFYKRCNSEGHNPFYCKNMHGMLSSYSYFTTASHLNRFNFNMTKLAAQEINRIARALLAMGIYHGGDQFLANLSNKTNEVMSLAEIENPLAYEKGLELGNACMSCHGERNNVVSPLNLGAFKASHL